MSRVYLCDDQGQRPRGITAAIRAAKRGKLVVVPTDTVYALAGDAFDPAVITNIGQAKGVRSVGRPTVFVGSTQMMRGLVTRYAGTVRLLAEAFWPGALTLLVEHSPSLVWNLGIDDRKLLVRMPLHPVALDVVNGVGPMVATGANLVDSAEQDSAQRARQRFGDSIAVYLDSLATGSGLRSTIVDLTLPKPGVIREGAVPIEQLKEVLPEVNWHCNESDPG